MATLFVLHNTLGSFFVAVQLAGLLLGVLGVQCWEYYNTYGKDPWYTKVLVAVTFVANILHQAFVCHALYLFTISFYGDPTHLTDIPWSFIGQSACNALIALFVQTFYIYRIWKLSKRNWFMAGGLMAIAITQFVINTIMCAKVQGFETYLQVPEVQPLITAFSALGAGVDGLIAISMVWLLMQNKTGFKGTNSMISKMVIYSANTGILTSAAAILTVVLLVRWPNASINYPAYFALGRLYGNSLVGILNARRTLRNVSSSSGQHPDEISLSLQGRSGIRGVRSTGFADVSSSHTPKGLVISVEHSVLHEDPTHSQHEFADTKSSHLNMA